MIYIMPDKKGDDELLDYVFNFDGRLDDGETVTSIIKTEIEAGITQVGDPTISGDNVKIWLEGGTPNTWYRCTCVIQTSAGRKIEDTFKVYVVAHR
ncbi:MAG: hypothetical protein JW866_03140 [Ignavibacteriales bacterium]|nr:hypothetical protein [Ignavibacteriales bacterium]